MACPPPYSPEITTWYSHTLEPSRTAPTLLLYRTLSMGISLFVGWPQKLSQTRQTHCHFRRQQRMCKIISTHTPHTHAHTHPRRISNRNTFYACRWSFGVLLLEIFTYGALPYSNLGNTQVQTHVQAGNRPAVPDEIATTHNLSVLFNSLSYAEFHQPPLLACRQTLVHSCFTRAAAARPNTNSVISELDARIADAGGFDPSFSRGSSRTSMLSANAVA
jgi:hypothetical protein